MRKAESKEAIAAVDEVLASVGLRHGRRSTRAGSWEAGERVGTGAKPAAARSGRRGTLEVVRADWGEYDWLRHGFSTRSGGGSTVYGGRSLNLGWTREDDPEAVRDNRRRFLAAVEGRGDRKRGSAGTLVTLRQFHSGLIRVVRGADGLATAEGKPVLRGDGLITDVPGLMLGVGTADCVPVLVADTRARVVAAFHAGWRGTLARIVERGVGTMRLEFGSRPEDLVAAVGPAIGGCCYSVGEEVRFEFESQFRYAPELFTEVYDSDPVREKYPLLFLTARAPGHSNIGPQTHLDLAEANRRQLLDAGLEAERVTSVGQCTACARNPDGHLRYFSHRGEHGFAGRMLSVIGIDET